MKEKIKQILNEIRELFWPILEQDDTGERSPGGDNSMVKPKEVKISDENLELGFQLQTRVYQDEEDRRKGTESKAALFMGSLSVATSIIIAANALVWDKEMPDFVLKLSVTVLVVLSIYTLRTVWFSVKVLERGTYHVLGEDEINASGDKKAFLSHLIATLSEMIRKNETTINMKVTHLTMAQEYYKRAIGTICIYALVVLFYCFFI